MQKFEIPFTLPSKGKLYDKFDGSVTVSPIRGSQEEILAGSGEANQALMLRQVTQQLITLPVGFKFYDLLVTDWLACLFQILGLSYGPSIPMAPKCPECKKQNKIEAKISELECRTADAFDESYREPFSVTLPMTKDNVSFRLMRLSDMQKIEDYTTGNRRMGINKSSHIFGIALQILGINGKSVSQMEAISWASSAISGDLNFLRNEAEAKETGYNLTPQFSCNFCGALFAVQLPLDGSFFHQPNSANRTA